MSHTVEKMSGEPVIVIRFNADFDAQAETLKAMEESGALMAKQTEPTFTIWDARLSTVDLEGMMVAANLARSETPPPNFRGNVVLTSKAFVKAAMKGMDSEIYKHMVIPVFEQMDEALTYIHAQLNQAS